MLLTTSTCKSWTVRLRKFKICLIGILALTWWRYQSLVLHWINLFFVYWTRWIIVHDFLLSSIMSIMLMILFLRWISNKLFLRVFILYWTCRCLKVFNFFNQWVFNFFHSLDLGFIFFQFVLFTSYLSNFLNLIS